MLTGLYCLATVPDAPCTDSLSRVPIALQWMFPTPLAILLFFAPESPWWLVRKGRLEQAEKSVRRLGRSTAGENPADSVAMMRRTIELEKSEKKPSLIELWKGTDRYRTLIVCGVYASQNLTGNLIANQAVYFFQREFPPYFDGDMP
jgi:MFS transporter, SP family, general alpha glucoside:H+ symporter